MYLSAWDWLCCLYIIQEIKEPLHFACINYTTVVVFIYGIGLVLSCQIQDDLSLHHRFYLSLCREISSIRPTGLKTLTPKMLSYVDIYLFTLPSEDLNTNWVKIIKEDDKD